jgi:soluble lytic murein transglycosylase
MHATRAALLGAAALIFGAAAIGAANAGSPVARPTPRPAPAGHASLHTEAPAAMQPLPKPDLRPTLSQILSPADHDLFERAFRAGDHHDWNAARGLADMGHDRVARRIIIWRYLTDKNGGATFAQIARFLRDYPDWPLRHVLFARAEQAMPENMAPGSVIAWFGARDPSTGIGKVRLGDALIATGKIAEGHALIRTAWIEGTFEASEEADIIRRHGDILTPDIDRQRLARLIWRGEYSAARRELSRVTSTAQRIAEVRMALRTSPRAGERMVTALPQSLQSDPGLMFDRARGLRRTGNDDDVPGLLIKAPTDQMTKIDPGHWWGELAIAAREALKDNQYHTAYALISDTGLSHGADFAQAEFMAGWVALRFLHDPQKALIHFTRLAEGVTRPISLGRAHYWAGRSYEAMGMKWSAARQYRLAAENPETFYGQLAATRIAPHPHLHLIETPVSIERHKHEFQHDGLIHAIRVLADLNEERFLRVFAVHDVEKHPSPGHVALLASELTRMGFRNIAVRVAKQASYDGIDLLPYSHPVIALPRYRGPGDAPEHALVLGLIRQETEFNADAVSRVGARGIMQLMPQTARHMARLSRLPYRHHRLATDPHYNIQLGMTELSTDLAKWDGSYILAAAAYNAGSLNVLRWIKAYGDPRGADVDPIDWIEQIPFPETRNYVQRVIENTEVYRNRLAGGSQPLQILADLYRPRRPPQKNVLALPPQPAALPKAAPVPDARPDPARSNQAGAAAPHATETAELGAAREAAANQPQPTPRPAADTAPKAPPATPKGKPAH